MINITLSHTHTHTQTQVRTTGEDDDTWHLDRAAVLSKIHAAKELDRDARGALRAGFDQARKMDEHDKGRSADARAGEAARRIGTRRTRGEGPEPST